MYDTAGKYDNVYQASYGRGPENVYATSGNREPENVYATAGNVYETGGMPTADTNMYERPKDGGSAYGKLLLSLIITVFLTNVVDVVFLWVVEC